MEWIAHYSDETELKQFENGKEHLFKEIDQNNLSKFGLFKDNRRVGTVNLKTGEISTTRFALFPRGIFKDAIFRLLYIRRVRMQLGGSGPATTENIENSNITYILGWQTTINGKNYKRVVSFNNNKIAIECD